MDPFFLVKPEKFFSQARSDSLAHIVGVHSEGGDPRAFFDTETEIQDVADQKADDSTLGFSNKTGILPSPGITGDDPLEIDFDRFLGDGGVDLADGFRILDF